MKHWQLSFIIISRTAAYVMPHFQLISRRIIRRGISRDDEGAKERVRPAMYLSRRRRHYCGYYDASASRRVYYEIQIARFCPPRVFDMHYYADDDAATHISARADIIHASNYRH